MNKQNLCFTFAAGSHDNHVRWLQATKMIIMKKLMYQVAFLTNTWSKQPTVTSLEEFISQVRNGQWKVPAEGNRRCLQQGRKHDADTIKNGMACIVPAGTCHKGHAQKDLVTLSCLLCLDFDDTNERTQEITAKARRLAYVVAAFISISGTGVKLMIRIDIEEASQFPVLYAATAALVSGALHFDCDTKCKDITHLCFGSYDPNAYYNDDAQPVNSFLPQEPIQPLVTAAPITALPTWTYTPENSPFSPGWLTSPAPPAYRRISAAAFAQSSLTLYPATKGDRHGTVFRLSCEAWKRGINPEELANELVRLLEETDFQETEIRRTVKSAYQHKEQCTPPENTPKLPPNFQTSLLDISPVTPADQIREKVSGEELRALTPTFPDEIYDWIPGIFVECVRMTRDKREKDGLLLASITTVSSMLPTVSCRYNRRKYGTNLYCIIIAPSGNSKGLFAYGLRLHKDYYAYWEKLNKKAEAAYEEECRKYEQMQQQSRRGKGASTSNTAAGIRAPEEPKLQFPMIPPDISKAKLIQHLINNEKCSSILASTETATVSTARGRDYGQFDDIFCKAFEHEPVSSSYKATGQRPIRVERPYLSTFFTCTPAGLLQFTPTTENGLFSRELPYTYCQPPIWQDVFAEEEESMDDLFDLLSARFCRLALFLKESPTIVTFTDEQKRTFNEHFTKLLAETDLLGIDDLLSVVKRHGVMTVRLCMIFTAIDKATLGMNVPTIVCSDAHFKAALAIVECCLEHSKLLIGSLRSSAEDVKPLQAPDRMQQFLASLPTEFTTETALRLGEEFEMSVNNVHKALHKANKKQIIKRLSHGVYRKIS